MSFICLRMKNDFHYQGLSTYPRFETEARGNSEMVYYIYVSFSKSHFELVVCSECQKQLEIERFRFRSVYYSKASKQF